ncbi:SIMPL domain-containing protein [Fodinicola feengrottensis]|uniref:SIMPL domain-containing protein n=1 Tax=Fodinicola feengrottensis TaxID=435914 RepID=A0ABN2GRS8_9ACTN
MAEIVTTGTGQVERLADRARLTVSFQGAGTTRAEAVTALNARLGDVEPAMQVVGVRVASRLLSVSEQWEENRRVGSVAQQRYVLVFRDLTQLPDLVGRLAALEPAELDGPHWLLADSTDARREAQGAALTDARVTAEGYATSLGAQLGPLVKLVDQGGGFQPRMMAYGGGQAVDVSNLSLEPELVSVSATCETTWHLL